MGRRLDFTPHPTLKICPQTAVGLQSYPCEYPIMTATEKISVTIARDELASAKRLAADLGLSLSSFISDAVRERVREEAHWLRTTASGTAAEKQFQHQPLVHADRSDHRDFFGAGRDSFSRLAAGDFELLPLGVSRRRD